jgi:hypothetical protein
LVVVLPDAFSVVLEAGIGFIELSGECRREVGL